MTDKIALKRVDFTKERDYGHILDATFRGKKTSAGHRGTLDIVLSVETETTNDPVHKSRGIAVTEENRAIAKRVLDKIKTQINDIMINPFAAEFSCYHNAAGVQYDVDSELELLKPNRQGTVWLHMDQIKALDEVMK